MRRAESWDCFWETTVSFLDFKSVQAMVFAVLEMEFSRGEFLIAFLISKNFLLHLRGTRNGGSVSKGYKVKIYRE